MTIAQLLLGLAVDGVAPGVELGGGIMAGVMVGGDILAGIMVGVITGVEKNNIITKKEEMDIFGCPFPFAMLLEVDLLHS